MKKQEICHIKRAQKLLDKVREIVLLSVHSNSGILIKNAGILIYCSMFYVPDR